MRHPLDCRHAAAISNEHLHEVDWDEENNQFLYLKYEFDGAATLAELSAALRALAEDVDSQAAGGWQLSDSVDSGRAHLKREAAD